MVVTQNTDQKVTTFKQTSDDPYLRHHYKLVYTDGRNIVFDNYEDVQVTWFQTASQFLSHVDVLDIKQRGFK